MSNAPLWDKSFFPGTRPVNYRFAAEELDFGLL